MALDQSQIEEIFKDGSTKLQGLYALTTEVSEKLNLLSKLKFEGREVEVEKTDQDEPYTVKETIYDKLPKSLDDPSQQIDAAIQEKRVNEIKQFIDNISLPESSN